MSRLEIVLKLFLQLHSMMTYDWTRIRSIYFGFLHVMALDVWKVRSVSMTWLRRVTIDHDCMILLI